ncbi:energy transducer TonB [Pedobacter faecalis]|uniref:energy transducer TonB n=1 Tax=Pedobacter faecalis TaxID=3041495 RepID=UPI0025505293|nr:energy transducer TonB [Pedobacter sp. ELA7]
MNWTINACLPTALLGLISMAATAQNLNKVNQKIDRNCYVLKEKYTALQANPEIRHGYYFASISSYDEEGQYTQGQRSGVWTCSTTGIVLHKYDFDQHKEIQGVPSKLVTRISIKDPGTGQSKDLPVQNIYLGGDTKMLKVVVNCLRYPAEAAEKRITGKVRIRFVLGADGKMRDEVPLTNLGGGLEGEALRVFRLMPQDWLPVFIDGKPVDAEVEMLLAFNLS